MGLLVAFLAETRRPSAWHKAETKESNRETGATPGRLCVAHVAQSRCMPSSWLCEPERSLFCLNSSEPFLRHQKPQDPNTMCCVPSPYSTTSQADGTRLDAWPQSSHRTDWSTTQNGWAGLERLSRPRQIFLERGEMEIRVRIC